MRSIVILCAAMAVSLSGCVRLTAAWADLSARGDTANPPALTSLQSGQAITNADQWTSEIPALQDAFQTHIYGRMPDAHAISVTGREVLDENAFGGLGILTEYKVTASVEFDGVARATTPFYMNAVFPKNATAPAPVILMETFCPRAATFPHPAVNQSNGGVGCASGGIGGAVARYIFGRYIATPPISEILERGYAIATIYPSEYAPDSSENGLAALNAMVGMDDAVTDEEPARWGAIAAWALGFSFMIDVLESEPLAANAPMITWGHSRYGKSALLAAAFDDRIDGVISHQSGTGGASLNRNKKGESVKAITAGYPHWFAPRYAEYAGATSDMPVDQHQLLALIAPRPVLLGNARRDVWSDPNGAFRAAIGADPVFELLGSNGLEQDRLDEWRPEADLAFWIRPGTHGVVKEDWPAFLEFLDAHF